MLNVLANSGCIQIGRRVTVSFHRTLRVPDDGGSYPLPPSFGRLPIYECAAHRCRLPKAWDRPDDFFIPLHQREALWLGFDGEPWHPSALLIGADGVNVITGESWDGPLSGSPQNYVVVPDQPWLDGIRTSGGLVRQFVAMPLGHGFTVMEQLRTTPGQMGIQLRVHEAEAGRFPDEAPPANAELDPSMTIDVQRREPTLGIGAGGAIVQKIYPDPYGTDGWESDETARARVHIVNSAQFTSITGVAPPPSVISAIDYTKRGLPWFELWDEERGDVGSQAVLEELKSIDTVAKSAGLDQQEPTVHIPEHQLKKIRRKN